ncbi:hypothetical protein [Streptomyces sp. SID13031]|uniref:hypothetical protein n=1 Tax=Streptomyces sp. SID13031 TaxID=2706046 RepID=UPI0013CB7511|nr:hypothetical protein [Streptomyces sp. SID13031]NEA36215.1 hypothetical protein [Streptomyces sp. SID13031]
MYDRRLIGGCWGVPLAWDGTPADLPGGFTESLARSVESQEAGLPPLGEPAVVDLGEFGHVETEVRPDPPTQLPYEVQVSDS